jgi:hypothetical protein
MDKKRTEKRSVAKGRCKREGCETNKEKTIGDVRKRKYIVSEEIPHKNVLLRSF